MIQMNYLSCNRMKIIYLASIRLPTEKAHGVQIMKTCEAFAGKGHDVELAVPTRANSISEDPFEYYRVKRLFKITTLKVPDLVSLGGIGFFFSSLYFAERARWLKQFWEADIIYSRDALVLLQYLLLGRRLIYEAHGAPTLLARFVARFAYRIVAISQATGESFISIGVPREKIVVAPDGVDLDAFAHPELKEAARVRLGLPQDKKIVMYIGRVDGWKGVDTLCEAARLLPSYILVVIIGGEPEQIAILEKQYPQVRFLGFRPYRELADNQAVADALILPNTGKSEVSMLYTSPLKLFSYMASGIPIVASDTPATREVLSDEDAYFFIPDDSRALVGQIEVVFANTEQSHEKATRAKEKVKAYTWQERAKQILSTLSTTIKS